MKLLLKTLSGVGCALLLYGCGTPPAPEPVPDVVEEHVPAIGTITLIRTEPEPTADEVLVYSNSLLLAVIGNESYVELEFPSGPVMLTLDWQDTPMKFREEIVLDTEFATNKYLTISHKFDVPEISKKEGGTDYTMEETLMLFELPEKLGRNMVKNLNPEYSYVFGPED